MKKVLTQFKREFWESRASFIRTPLYLGGFMLGIVVLGLFTADRNLERAIGHMQSAQQEGKDIDPQFLHLLASGDLFAAHPQILGYGLAAIYTLFMLVLLLVLHSYLTGALYTDRRDQSILFWKSLPITERQNVLTKLGTGALAAPAAYMLAAFATGACYLLLLSVYTGFSSELQAPGLGVLLGAYFNSIWSLALAWLLLALWALPLFSYLLLCSAAAKKAPFLIAVGIPLALMILEIWVLGSANLWQLFKDQTQGALGSFFAVLSHSEPAGRVLAESLSSPILWGGLVFTGVAMTACIWLRNYRYEL